MRVSSANVGLMAGRNGPGLDFAGNTQAVSPEALMWLQEAFGLQDTSDIFTQNYWTGV